MKFKIGDTVRLKSGGPVMTVTQEHSPGIVTCNWFINNDLKEGSFPEDTLEVYDKKAIAASLSKRTPPQYFQRNRR